MSGASTSDARKRRAPVADPVKVVARAINPHYPDFARGVAGRIVAALRAEGMLP